MKSFFTIAYYIYNKDHLIEKIADCLRKFEGIPKIVLFDGCTDRSVEKFLSIRSNVSNLRTFSNGPHDLFETKSNNFLLRTFNTECCVLLQDDQFPRNTDFLKLAHRIFNEDGRAGIVGFKDGYEMSSSLDDYEDFISAPWSNSKSKGTCLQPGEFARRTFVNRGPFLVHRRLIDTIGFLDEKFAPLFWDDNDYCLRASKAGLNSYVAYAEIQSNREWSGTVSGSKLPLKSIYLSNRDRFARKWRMSCKQSPSLPERIASRSRVARLRAACFFRTLSGWDRPREI